MDNNLIYSIINQYFVTYTSRLGNITFLRNKDSRDGSICYMTFKIQTNQLIEDAKDILTKRYGKPSHINDYFNYNLRSKYNIQFWELLDNYAVILTPINTANNDLISSFAFNNEIIFYDAKLINNYIRDTRDAFEKYIREQNKNERDSM